jgi:hypothetical protein
MWYRDTYLLASVLCDKTVAKLINQSLIPDSRLQTRTVRLRNSAVLLAYHAVIDRVDAHILVSLAWRMYQKKHEASVHAPAAELNISSTKHLKRGVVRQKTTGVRRGFGDERRRRQIALLSIVNITSTHRVWRYVGPDPHPVGSWLVSSVLDWVDWTAADGDVICGKTWQGCGGVRAVLRPPRPWTEAALTPWTSKIDFMYIDRHQTSIFDVGCLNMTDNKDSLLEMRHAIFGVD